MPGFGNNAFDGYTAKRYQHEPAWEKDVDYCPDHRPSTGREVFITPPDGSVLCLLHVRGLGVMTFRAVSNPDDPRGRLRFTGVANYTLQEIGWSETLK